MFHIVDRGGIVLKVDFLFRWWLDVVIIASNSHRHFPATSVLLVLLHICRNFEPVSSHCISIIFRRPHLPAEPPTMSLRANGTKGAKAKTSKTGKGASTKKKGSFFLPLLLISAAAIVSLLAATIAYLGGPQKALDAALRRVRGRTSTSSTLSTTTAGELPPQADSPISSSSSPGAESKAAPSASSPGADPSADAAAAETSDVSSNKPGAAQATDPELPASTRMMFAASSGNLELTEALLAGTGDDAPVSPFHRSPDVSEGLLHVAAIPETNGLEFVKMIVRKMTEALEREEGRSAQNSLGVRSGAAEYRL